MCREGLTLNLRRVTQGLIKLTLGLGDREKVGRLARRLTLELLEAYVEVY